MSFHKALETNFEEEQMGGSRIVNALYAELVSYMEGSVLLCMKENGRLKALVNVFHPCCISGYRRQCEVPPRAFPEAERR
jgi:hypothetical protein